MSIIVKLFGGLGNQMFQYAAGRALACRTGKPLKLDISSYRWDTLREYRLGSFKIREDFATLEEIERWMAGSRPDSLNVYQRILRKLRPWHRQMVIRERSFSFDPAFMKIRGSCYLQEGYWQSEKYFKDYEEQIRKDFTFRDEPDETNRRVLEEIRSSNAVSLHIRRGDYVRNPKTRSVHGVLGLDYYRKAIGVMAKRVVRPKFFVFSDEIEWAKENLETGHPVTFVDHNREGKDVEDLRLMKHCRHHIIANSSFSWWGAWLNDDPEKLVIAPRNWFSEKEMAQKDTSDLIPVGWKIIGDR